MTATAPVHIQTCFQGLEASLSLEQRVTEYSHELARRFSGITRITTLIRAPHRPFPAREGSECVVRVDVRLPRTIVIADRFATPRHNPFLAVREAFDTAERQLRDPLRDQGHVWGRHEGFVLRLQA